MELIQTDTMLSSVEVWAGMGSCHFPGISVLDPDSIRMPLGALVSGTGTIPGRPIVGDFLLPPAMSVVS